MKRYNVAIVGATGMVGRKFIETLEKRRFPIADCFLFASSKSAGKKMECFGGEYTVIELTRENVLSLKGKVEFALFSAGAAVSKEFAPLFCEIGATVVDNSSQWRMHDDVPLVVPEVNPQAAMGGAKLIANPNCSTIQAVVALKPLDDAFKIKRVVISTYQAVSGAGVRGVEDLTNGLKGEEPKKFPHQIAFNILPHIDVFLEDGYTKEEKKMIDETRKILGRADLKVTATATRVPVYNAHSESINVEFEKPCTAKDARAVLAAAKGIKVVDDPSRNEYPLAIEASGKDEVFVGRIRDDESVASGINMWVVADNLLKGAALNAVQILELLKDE